MREVTASRHDFETDSADSVDQLTQRNIEAVKQLEEAAKEERSASDRVADAIANFCGSMTFVLGTCGLVWVLDFDQCDPTLTTHRSIPVYLPHTRCLPRSD